MIALDPQQTVDFWLTSDDGVAPASRPTFTTRYLTCRNVLAAQALADEAFDLANDPRHVAAQDWAPKALAALTLGLCGWRNVIGLDGLALSFAPENLLGVLTEQELLELPYRMIRAVRLSEPDRKKSLPLSPDATATAGNPEPSTSNAESVPVAA